MTTRQSCPQCGSYMPADGPQGVCPKCFLGIGLHRDAGSSDNTEGFTQGAFQPPKPKDLAQHFPQLEILALVGHGGMGAVYKARQRGLDRIVALKILPPNTAGDPAFAERFGREARALAKLSHPNIVGVYDSGVVGELYFFLMEFVDGVNLRQAIQSGEFSSKEALAIVPQLCEALQYAHDEGIVHRDIKPENVLIDNKGRVKIADFGLARLLGAEADFALTATHQVLGTPRYMAPEQMEGATSIDHRADIYSLGVVFYEMLTGELPLGRFEPPSKRVQVDVRLDEIVLRTLEKEPDRRYQHASEVKTDVESLTNYVHMPKNVRKMYGYEYRSPTTVFGVPLVHVAAGIDPRTGKRRVAKGIFAMGDAAFGLFAIGGFACGGFALGGCSIGLLTFGGISLGLLLAIGGAAIGIGLSLGGFAVGTVAVGGCAIGIVAVGGGAFGIYGYGPNAQDPAEMFLVRRFGVTLLTFTIVAAFVSIPFIIALATIMTRLAKKHSDLPDDLNPKYQVSTRPMVSRSLNSSAIGLVFALLAGLLICSGLILAIPTVSYVTRYEGREQAATITQDSDLWSFTEIGPQIHDNGAQFLSMDLNQRTRVNAILAEIYDEYLALEAKHTTQSLNEAGHQLTRIAMPTRDVAMLVDRLWTNLDAELNDFQQTIARNHLSFYEQDAASLKEPRVYGPHVQEAVIEVWQVGSWYHWREQLDAVTTTVGQGPNLPSAFQRFWRPVSPS